MCARERNDRFLTGNETTDLSEQYRYTVATRFRFCYYTQ